MLGYEGLDRRERGWDPKKKGHEWNLFQPDGVVEVGVEVFYSIRRY